MGHTTFLSRVLRFLLEKIHFEVLTGTCMLIVIAIFGQFLCPLYILVLASFTHKKRANVDFVTNRKL